MSRGRHAGDTKGTSGSISAFAAVKTCSMCRKKTDVARGRDPPRVGRSFHRSGVGGVFCVLLLIGTLLACEAGGNGTPDVYRILGGAKNHQADYDYTHVNDVEDEGHQGDLYIGRSGDPWSSSSRHNYEEDILARVPSSMNNTKARSAASSGKEVSSRVRIKRGVIHLYNMVVCATGCNPLAYKGYGCYCGFLGSGYVIDGIDQQSRCNSTKKTLRTPWPRQLGANVKERGTMLSYMLPTEDKPPPGESSQNNYRVTKLQKSNVVAGTTSPRKCADVTRTMIVSTRIEDHAGDPRHAPHPQRDSRPIESPKHNGTAARKSTLHNARVTKDDSLYSIDSDASTAGSERKNKILNGAKHANLKRVSFGSSKGSMVETLVYETPVQEEPEINHFLDHNGRLPPPMIPVPDTDEGREKVRVSLLGPQPSPATPGVLLLEPITTGHPIDMASNPAELLTTHTEHTTPSYHAQISTDSGWDNPFRPDGDLSREADEIVELIKGGKPITPTPGQNAPPLPGCEASKTPGGEHDPSSTSPLLKSSNCHANSSPRPGQENGNAHGTPAKIANASNQPVNEKVGVARTATVEVARMTAQGPGDASQVEHVTLKKKPKCKCCVLQ